MSPVIYCKKGYFFESGHIDPNTTYRIEHQGYNIKQIYNIIWEIAVEMCSTTYKTFDVL